MELSWSELLYFVMAHPTSLSYYLMGGGGTIGGPEHPAVMCTRLDTFLSPNHFHVSPLSRFTPLFKTLETFILGSVSIASSSAGELDEETRALPRWDDLQLLGIIGYFKKYRFSRDESHIRSCRCLLVILHTQTHTQEHDFDSAGPPHTAVLHAACLHRLRGKHQGEPGRVKCFQMTRSGFVAARVYFYKRRAQMDMLLPWNVLLKCKKDTIMVQLALIQLGWFICGK